ncbi:MAG TPA: hypothetical protein VFR31_03535 [Thermoanaerobaculia bacterium]|nr:hypothetical protein [Thermoanaerobaculia bacterium]
MEEIVIDQPASEASALLAIESKAVLDAHGWEMAFWSCSDEDRIEKSLHALGKGKDGWELVRPGKVRTEPKVRTEDAEAMARFGPWIYVFGSHFGTKSGPLEPTRHFIARFREDRLDGRLDDCEVEMEIARGRFKLHRLLNDALRESGIPLLHPGDEQRRCIRETRHLGRKKRKKWAGRIRKDDWPVDIEGAAFRNNGALLLGLRNPSTRDGHPVLVEIEGIEKLFRDPADDPAVRQLWVLDGVGSAREPRGIRALEEDGDSFLAVTGSLDSTPEESAILQDHPEGERANSCLHRFSLPESPPRWSGIEAERVQDLEGSRAEGLAADTRGRLWYVLDDERIRLRQVG